MDIQTAEKLRQNMLQQLADYESEEKESDIADFRSSDMDTNSRAADRISAHYSVASYLCDVAMHYEDKPSPIEHLLQTLCESDEVLSTAAEIYSEAGLDSRPTITELLEMTVDTIEERNNTILKNAELLSKKEQKHSGPEI